MILTVCMLQMFDNYAIVMSTGRCPVHTLTPKQNTTEATWRVVKSIVGQLQCHNQHQWLIFFLFMSLLCLCDHRRWCSVCNRFVFAHVADRWPYDLPRSSRSGGGGFWHPGGRRRLLQHWRQPLISVSATDRSNNITRNDVAARRAATANKLSKLSDSFTWLNDMILETGKLCERYHWSLSI